MDEDFASAARQVMRAHRLTQHALAKRLAYTDAYLSRILSGKQRPSEQIMRSMDEQFGTSLTALTPDDRERVTYSMSRPGRVDEGTVKAFADVLASLRRFDDRVGSEWALEPARTQFARVKALAETAGGPQRVPLLRVAAEWAQFAGWLNAATRRDETAIDLFSRSEELADEAGDATIAAIAVSFRGYVARQQGRPGGVVRASLAALHTHGSHPVQTAFDTIQAAQGYAAMGQAGEAEKFLGKAEELVAKVPPPPAELYWYSDSFLLATIGLTHSQMGSHRKAADLLGAGLAGMPEDQRTSDWAAEYRDALEVSSR